MQQFTHGLLILLLCLSGCDGSKKPIEPTPDKNKAAIAQAESLAQAGQFVQAARLYQTLANSTSGVERPALQLNAADLWVKAGQYDVATQMIGALEELLAPEDNLTRRLIQAEIAIHFRQMDQALQLLDPTPDVRITKNLLGRRHKIRAQAFQLNGNLLEQADELSKLDTFLQIPEKKIANQKVILQVLSKLTVTALNFLQPPPSDPLAGWMALALINKTYLFETQDVTEKIQQWRLAYPDHPIDPQLLVSMTTSIQERSKPIDQIALLLPQNGAFVNAASAFRDGFLAAYYTQSAPSPMIKLYDTSGENSIREVYRQAVAEGANFIVGPLAKKNVRGLYAEELDAPILALNYVDHTVRREQFFQFSLSPEDEARQVADKAWLDGLARAIVLVPENKFGSRVMQAFQERFEAIGGQILETQTYITKERDFSQPIQTLLNLDESEERQQKLKRRLGGEISFEPRRREDADFIFIAAKPVHARIIRPQLQFYRAQNLPIYAISQVYSGSHRPGQDQDLEGIFFCDIPWILNEDSEQLLSKDKLLAFWPDISERYIRLYAMGIDAYALVSELPWLSDNRDQTFDGKTGHLYLDENLQLHRQLVWARFKNGVPTSLGYAPTLDAVGPASTEIESEPPILVQ